MEALLKVHKKKSLGETYKHINEHLETQRGDAFIKYNPSYNVFQKKVQAIYIDTFKVKEGVVSCLLSNDLHIVRRILKCDWFFEDALSPMEYEDIIFPKVSFSTRCKIINQLARHVRSEEHAEEFFTFVERTFGRKYAEKFLPRCGFKFVASYIENAKPEFNYHDSETVLINTCKRHSRIIIPFLQREMCNGLRGSLQRCPKLIKYLSKNHPVAFLFIFEKMHAEMGNFHFGKKATKSLKSQLIALAQKIPVLTVSEKMKVSVIFKHLGFEDQKMFLKLLVQAYGGPNFQEMRYWAFASRPMINLLELKPPNQRVTLVEAVFQELFNENYVNHPELWSFQFLEVFPEAYRTHLLKVFQRRCEERELSDFLLSQCLDREREVKETFLYLADFGKAFSLLSRLMDYVATKSRREIILREMIRSSVLDGDPASLETVLTYVIQRHQNDEPRMIYYLLLNHVIQEVPSKMITEKSWSLIEKLAAALSATVKEHALHRLVLEGYIAYSMKMNLSFQPLMKTIIKMNFLTSEGTVLIRNMKKWYARDLIIGYYREIFSGDEVYAENRVKNNFCTSLILTVNSYNNSTRRNRIRIDEELPLLVQHVDKMINEKEWTKKHAFTLGIFHNAYLRNKYAHLLLQFSMKPPTLFYLLKHHPEHIMKNMDKIINYVFESDDNKEYEKFFASKCRIDFLGWNHALDSKVSALFRSSPSPVVKANALKFYSHISNMACFKNLVLQYLPFNRGPLFKSSKKDLHEIQIMIPELIKNVKPVTKNWKMIFYFLSKDFLRLILPSLLCYSHNSSSILVTHLLRYHLKDRSVAVRKVIVRCILDLSTNRDKFKLCRSLWQTESHPSMKEYLFRHILKSWREDRTAEIFEMVTRCIKESDPVIIKNRLKMELVPLPFLSDYTSLLWRFTQTCLTNRFTTVCREEMINYFNVKNISVVTGDVCHEILTQYLFQSEPNVRVEHFARAYLLGHPAGISEKTSFVILLMRQNRENYDAVKRFLECMKDIPKDDPKFSFFVFKSLLRVWPNLYSSCKMFKEHLFLKYMKAYSSAYRISSTMDEAFAAALGRELRKIVNAVSAHYNYADIFSSTLSDFITSFDFGKILGSVLDSFLGSSFDNTEGIIAINLLPNEVFENYKMNSDEASYNYPRNVEIRKKYSNVLDKLLDKDDEVLKVFMNLRLDNVLD